MNEMGQGRVIDRQGVLNAIQSDLGLSVARITPNSISIKDPTNENGRNIRPKGEIYADNFRFSQDYSAENERAKTTEQIVQNELTTLEQSLQQKLRESERLISNSISDHQTNLQLLAIILVMGLTALWTYKSLKDMRAEQAQIQATIDQMPLPPKVLNQFNIQQDEKFYYMATKNKKAEVFANKNGGCTIKIRK